VIFRSRTLPEFWQHYDALPEEIRLRAAKQYAIFGQNPRHPSLQLKPVGEFWSIRVTAAYRAVAFREENTFTWFWIGTHSEYERLIRG
jgi:hypothetical protein